MMYGKLGVISMLIAICIGLVLRYGEPSLSVSNSIIWALVSWIVLFIGSCFAYKKHESEAIDAPKPDKET